MTSSRSYAWAGRMLRLQPARFPLGHSIRSALAIALPLVVAAATGRILDGMWVALATLLIAAGEREGSHRLNVRILLIATPIAATGYFLGYLQAWPLWAIIPLMVVLGWVAGAIAGYGVAFSIAGMQFLLVAALAQGVSGYSTWWQPVVWYLVGAAFYLVMMLFEFALDRRRPERLVLDDVIDALDALVGARLADAGAERIDAERIDAVRERVVTALTRAREVLETGQNAGRRRRVHWAIFKDAVEAGDSLLAIVLGDDSASDLTRVQDQLEALRRGRARHEPATGLLAERARRFAVAVGNLGIGLGSPGEPRPRMVILAERSPRPWPERLSIGPEVRGAATRLALCCGIAYGAKAYLPIDHWYWVPLTVALVMKPDFGSVFGRALLRIIGTVIGALLAAAVIWLDPPPIGIALCVGVLAFFVPWLMVKSYALQAVVLAPAVILLVYSLNPDPAEDLPGQRILATAVGGVVVVVFGYLIWPAARRVDIPRALRNAIGALAAFLDLAAGPIPTDPGQREQRHRALMESRRRTYESLSDLRTHLQRGLTEPPPAYDQAAAWIPAIWAIDQLIDAAAAYSVRRREGKPVPDATGVAAQVRALPKVSSPPELSRHAAALAGQLTQPVDRTERPPP